MPLLINAPARIRDTHRDLPPARLLATLAGCRPGQVTDADQADILYSLRTQARRRHHRHLTTELTARIGARATEANPALLAIKGVAPVIGAQLLLTAGDNPQRLRSGPSFTGTRAGPRGSRSAPDAPTATASPAAGTAPPTAPCT